MTEPIELQPIELGEGARWKQRFRAWSIASTSIAALAPDRGLVVCNRSGVFQLHAWDVASGALTQLTDDPTGRMTGLLSPDGRFVYYLRDESGNEIGHIVRIPYAGGPPKDMTPGCDPYALAGMSISKDGSTLAFTTASREGFQLYVGELDPAGDVGPTRKIHHASALTRGAVLSERGELAMVATTERTGTIETNLVAIDTKSGEVVGELVDADASVEAGRFSRVPGDLRHLCATTRSGRRRPLLWDPHSDERVDFELDSLAGDVVPVAWSQDARTILLMQVSQAESRLHLLDPDSGEVAPFEHPAGTIASVYFDPHGEVVLALQSSAEKGRVFRVPVPGATRPRVLLEGGEAPSGRKWRSVCFTSSGQQSIQGWLGVPEGAGPFPTILETHGGPSAVMTDVYSPRAQTWLDHGFAYLTINYRGSTTFGRDFQRAIEGQLGALEVDDMAAARDWVVKEGIASPEAILLTGWSYGGYLTLQALGMRPELWAGGMAGIAIADWNLMYEDQAETLRRYQVGLFGGTPDEKPEAHARSSPITYAENVRAPILVIQGSNDTRCPARQMQAYERKLRELGKPIEVVWFEAGHGSYATEQNVEHTEHMLRFAYDVLSRTRAARSAR